METLRFRRWELRCDAAATRAAYEATEIGWAEYCGCVHCRNFHLARDSVYPAEVVGLLERLGIDRTKETEVYPYQEIDEASAWYAGHFHLVGEIASGPDFWTEQPGGGLRTNPEGVEVLTDEFRMGFTPRLTQVRRPFTSQGTLQLEWVAAVPWLLERRMPKRM